MTSHNLNSMALLRRGCPAGLQHLQQLQWLRMIVGSLQTITLLLAHVFLTDSAIHKLALLLLGQAALIVFTQQRLRTLCAQQVPRIRNHEWLLQLLADCALLSGMLYFAGGATNPFVSYLLVPIALSAATLPRHYTAALALCCLCAYNALLLYYEPLQIMAPHHQHHDQSPSLHVIGMWLNFGLSAGLIGYFVSGMATALQQQREYINTLREQQLMDENILTVATLAAGTAHELGTPLSSVAVLLSDLLAENTDNPALSADLKLMREQVARCQQSLRTLSDTAREHQQQQPTPRTLAAFLQQLIIQWQLLRPEAPVQFTLPAATSSRYTLPLTVRQAIINLLDNAADACEQQVAVMIDCRDDVLHIRIEDDGPGFDTDSQPRRQLAASDKAHGMGLGLLLSHASLERAGGRLSLLPRKPRGTCTLIELPLAPFAVDTEACPS